MEGTNGNRDSASDVKIADRSPHPQPEGTRPNVSVLRARTRRGKKKREGHSNRTSRKVPLVDAQGKIVTKNGRPVYASDPLAEAIGQELRKARETRGLTINKVAEKTGWSRQTINTYENGHALPPVDKLLQFAEMYMVSVEKLVRGQETMTLEAALAELPDDLRSGTMMLIHHPSLSRLLKAIQTLPDASQTILVELMAAMTEMKELDLEAIRLMVDRLRR